MKPYDTFDIEIGGRVIATNPRLSNLADGIPRTLVEHVIYAAELDTRNRNGGRSPVLLLPSDRLVYEKAKQFLAESGCDILDVRAGCQGAIDAALNTWPSANSIVIGVERRRPIVIAAEKLSGADIGFWKIVYDRGWLATGGAFPRIPGLGAGAIQLSDDAVVFALVEAPVFDQSWDDLSVLSKFCLGFRFDDSALS